MQNLRDNPMLAVGLLVVAVLALAVSWFFFMRPSTPEVEPIQAPPAQTDPSQGGYSPL